MAMFSLSFALQEIVLILAWIQSLWLINCFIWARGLGMARTAEAKDDVSALQVGFLS